MENPQHKAAREVLGLEIGFTEAQVKPAYIRRARECHPDKFQGHAKEAATAEFKLVNAAYLFLTSPAALKKGLEGEGLYTETLVAQIEAIVANDFLPRVTELLAQRDAQIQTVTENTAALRETAEAYRGLAALLHSPRVLAFFQRFNRTPNRASPARESGTESTAPPQTPTRTSAQTSAAPVTPQTRTARRKLFSPSRSRLETPLIERVAAPEASPAAPTPDPPAPSAASSKAAPPPTVSRNLFVQWLGL